MGEGVEATNFTKIVIPILIFSTRELQLQFPFQFVSCNFGNHLTEWGQLLIPNNVAVSLFSLETMSTNN